MSRDADAKKTKALQKANISASKDEKERLLAMGLNSTMKKLIADDVVICTRCGATKLGPPTACACPGGKEKPGEDCEVWPFLIAAAKQRSTEQKDATKLDNAKHQGAVAAGRAKRKDAKEMDSANAEVQGLDEEMDQIVEFPIGKLGMDLEKNVVSVIKEDDKGESTAKDLGVKPGWVVRYINGTPVGADKKVIMKEIMAIFKASKPVQFTFRVPTCDVYYCGNCEKFLGADQFEDCLTSKLPGQWKCAGCEEFEGFE